MRIEKALLHEVVQLGFVFLEAAFEFGDLQVEVDVFELGQLLPRLDVLAGFDVDFDEPARHVDVDRIGVAGLDFQRADEAVRQGEEEERQHQHRHDAETDVESRFFHLIDPPGHVKELAHLPQRHEEQPPKRRRHHDLADDLQMIGHEQSIEEPADRQRHHPAIERRGHRIEGEEHLVPLRQEGVVGRLQAQAPLAQFAAEDRGGLLPQVGDLHQVGEDIIAVVTQQRVGVEDDRGDRGDEHHVEAEVVEERLRLGEPPQEGGDRGDHQLDVHAGRADGRPLPLAGQHPGVGDVAVEAGREHQDHHAHLVAFAAEVLAAQPVAEFVEHLGDPSMTISQKALWTLKNWWKSGSLARKTSNSTATSVAAERTNSSSRRPRPARRTSALRIEPVQEPLGIEALEADAEHVAEAAENIFRFVRRGV